MSILAAASAAAGGVGAAPPTLAPEARRAVVADLADLVAIPNVAADPEGLKRSAKAIVERMAARGLAPRLLAPKDPAGPPAIYGEWRVPGAARTLVLYAHYDGQPVDPAAWTTPPFTPTLRRGALTDGAAVVSFSPEGRALDPDWRLYGRSTSDDKAQVVAMLAAVDVLRAAGRTPTSNLLFFFDGEEEAGSPHLAEILDAHRDLLASDLWVIGDGPLHQTGRMQVIFGVRGDVNVDLTVHGPVRPLHSGHYGNWVPNPAMRLAQLLASMKDDAGRVTIAGWYDGVEPMGDAERRAVREAPSPDERLKAELGVAVPDGPAASLADAIALPSLNVNGIRSGDAGPKARNVIPTSAIATLDLRVVRGVTVDAQVKKLADHVRRMGYVVLDREPTDEERRRHARLATLARKPGGYDAQRTPMDHPVATRILEAVRAASAGAVVAVPTVGGSLPLSIVKARLGAEAVTVPLANHDNNQHAEDENIRLGHLWSGIDVLAAILTMAP